MAIGQEEKEALTSANLMILLFKLLKYIESWLKKESKKKKGAFWPRITVCLKHKKFVQVSIGSAIVITLPVESISKFEYHLK